MSEKFTVNDRRTIAEFLNEYEMLEGEEDNAAFDEAELFLKKIKNYLDFIQCSTKLTKYTGAKSHFDLQVASLFSLENYAKAVVTLTGGFNENMQWYINNTRNDFKSDYYCSSRDFYDCINATFISRVVEEAIIKEGGGLSAEEMEEQLIEKLTISDIVNEINLIDELLDSGYEYIIGENAMDDAVEMLNEACSIGTQYSLDIMYDIDSVEKISAQKVKIDLYDKGYRCSDDCEEFYTFRSRIQNDFGNVYSSMNQLTAVCVLIKAYNETDIIEEAVKIAEKEIKEWQLPVQFEEGVDITKAESAKSFSFQEYHCIELFSEDAADNDEDNKRKKELSKELDRLRKSEQTRLGSKVQVSLFFRKALHYINEDGTLMVTLHPDEGKDSFLWLPKAGNNVVAQVIDITKHTYWRCEEFSAIPQVFVDIMDDYMYRRDEIGLKYSLYSDSAEKLNCQTVLKAESQPHENVKPAECRETEPPEPQVYQQPAIKNNTVAVQTPTPSTAPVQKPASPSDGMIAGYKDLFGRIFKK